VVSSKSSVRSSPLGASSLRAAAQISRNAETTLRNPAPGCAMKCARRNRGCASWSRCVWCRWLPWR
jgi:hypothetical protein